MCVLTCVTERLPPIFVAFEFAQCSVCLKCLISSLINVNPLSSRLNPVFFPPSLFPPHKLCISLIRSIIFLFSYFIFSLVAHIRQYLIQDAQYLNSGDFKTTKDVCRLQLRAILTE